MAIKRLLALAFGAALATSAQAADLGNLTDAERDAFRAEVRAYLLDNPEVLMEAIAVLEQRQEQARAAAEIALLRDNAEALFEDENSWVGGNPDGDIVMVEFLDYRCGYCRKAHDEVAELLTSDGNIRMIVKEYPILGEESVAASRFAIATRLVEGDDAYKSVGDSLITMRGNVTNDSLRRVADALNLDADEILNRMNSDEVTQIIAANHALGSVMQVQGTPTFVIGDQILRGYVPLNAMREIVAEERTN